ncbi:MAG TPA: DUF6186 family protein [Actinophytocola sp.]|uniref:DUF6186 family protein n=1 Tax=Actinophytocola sp. TaxID=1872138 RepID=UPI002F950E3C
MHALTVTVFALLGAGLVVLELVGRRSGARIPTVGRLLRVAMHKRPALVLVVLTWWWFGWHFFVSGG